MVLDIEGLEDNAAEPSMELAQAYDFIKAIRSATGRWPGLYGGFYLRQLLAGKPDAMLQNCWLWLSDYEASPHILPGWDQWTLWQYTDDTHGNPPHDVAGIRECDRDIFNGESADELRAFWSGVPLNQGGGA